MSCNMLVHKSLGLGYSLVGVSHGLPAIHVGFVQVLWFQNHPEDRLRLTNTLSRIKLLLKKNEWTMRHNEDFSLFISRNTFVLHSFVLQCRNLWGLIVIGCEEKKHRKLSFPMNSFERGARYRLEQSVGTTGLKKKKKKHNSASWSMAYWSQDEQFQGLGVCGRSIDARLKQTRFSLAVSFSKRVS